MNTKRFGVIQVLGVMVLIVWAQPLLADKFECREWFRTGAGFRMTAANFAFMSAHQAIEVADINNDGLQDIVLLSDGSLEHTDDYSDVTGTIPNTAYLYNVAVAGHESPNIWAGRKGFPVGILYIGSDLAWMENKGYGYFTYHYITPLGNPALLYRGRTLRVGDVDGDGDMDIVVWCGRGISGSDDAPLGAGKVVWFENRQSEGLIVADGGPQFDSFDIVSLFDDGFSNGTDTFEVFDPRTGTLADMDADGFLDVVILNYSNNGGSDSIFYWIKNSGATPRFPQANTNPVKTGGSTHYNRNNGTVVQAGLVNGGTRMDLVVGEDGGSAQTSLLIQNASGRFPITSLGSEVTPKGLCVGDLVTGGRKEIISGGRSGSPVSVHYHSGGSWWSQTLQRNGSEREVWDVRVADFNSDGKQDILCFYVDDRGTLFEAGLAAITPPRYSVVSLYPGTGTHGYADWIPFALTEKTDLPNVDSENRPGGGLAVADFDRDGDQDVIRCHWGANVAYFENAWQTERHTEIITEVKKNGRKQTMTSVYSTRGDLSVDKRIGVKILNK